MEAASKPDSKESDEESSLEEEEHSEITPDKPLGKRARRNLNRRARRLRGERESYGVCLRKVLKEIHPDIGITEKAMNIVDSIIYGLLEQIATEASRVAKSRNKGTLNSKEIEEGVRAVLPDRLASRAIEEGNLVLSGYLSNPNEERRKDGKNSAQPNALMHQSFPAV